jgi:hypothetical protein
LAPLPVIVPPVEILVPIVVAALIMPTQARVAKREIIITLACPVRKVLLAGGFKSPAMVELFTSDFVKGFFSNRVKPPPPMEFSF